MNRPSRVLRHRLIALGGAALLGAGLCPALHGAPPAQPGPAVFRGKGICQFSLHDFKLPPEVESGLNISVTRLLEQYAATFGFKPASDFRVRIRIFGRFEDYEAHASQDRSPLGGMNITNVAGYFALPSREVVTWRQRHPGYLPNNILHEAGHAILHGHFRRVPPWLDEGAATYFSFPRYLQDEDDVRSLKHRWARLNDWLRTGTLPALKPLLDMDRDQWSGLDLDRAYTGSWSLFQFLMSNPENKQTLQKFVRELQLTRNLATPPSQLLDRSHHGGLKRLEAGWHDWIRDTGRKVLADPKAK